MAARRCSTCAINWPTTVEHVKCDVCDGATDWVSGEKPHSLEEIFEVCYAARGEKPLTKEDAAIVEYLAKQVDEIVALEAIPVAGEPIPVAPLPPEHFGKDAHTLRRYA